MVPWTDDVWYWSEWCTQQALNSERTSLLRLIRPWMNQTPKKKCHLHVKSNQKMLKFCPKKDKHQRRFEFNTTEMNLHHQPNEKETKFVSEKFVGETLEVKNNRPSWSSSRDIFTLMTTEVMLDLRILTFQIWTSWYLDCVEKSDLSILKYTMNTTMSDTLNISNTGLQTCNATCVSYHKTSTTTERRADTKPLFLLFHLQRKQCTPCEVFHTVVNCTIHLPWWIILFTLTVTQIECCHKYVVYTEYLAQGTSKGTNSVIMINCHSIIS